MTVSTARTLAAITRDVLSMLGEPTVKALIVELGLLGVSMKAEEFDIIKVDQGLRKIFGEATELFMKQIYNEFKTKLLEDGMNVKEIEIADKESISAAEKIAKLSILKASR